ncbi:MULTISPECIES: hypothetical protein [unclassified Streptomyces]|uniref:hypothetical protein n=1 Tax=unclassified Streptomyces TaxID=2593676 RepID=UPI002E35C6D5|nr:hypothetical protein [Streptomyces sp. NBC_01689]
MTTPDRTRTADTPPGERQIERLLARRRSIVAWCDRHLMAIHALSALMTDDPGVVDAALSEVLSHPVEPAHGYTQGEDHAPSVTTTHRAFSQPAPRHLPATRDHCPHIAASPYDRIELALHLVGERSCTGVSRILGLPERAVAARLRSGLWMLFTPCDGDSDKIRLL